LASRSLKIIKKLKNLHLRRSINKWLTATHTKGIVDWIIKQRDAYPVIVFALMPTLYFWTKNNIQELGPSLMFRSLLAAIAFGLIYYIIWYLILHRDKFKASLLATITIITTFTYGQIFDLYQKFAPSKFEADRYFILLIIIVYVALVYLVIKKIKYSNTIRNYLALFATVLLILNLYPLVKYWTTNYGLGNTPFGPDIKVVNKTKSQPDIYYLVFDRYANQKVLKDVYDFDNSLFLNLLKDKGFYVASNSTANYPFTTFSLAMSLNLGYLPDNFKDRPDSGLYYTLMKDKMENNKAALFLKDQGYSFINIGPWWTATKYNKNADQDLYNPSGLTLLNKKVDLKEHELILFQDTIFWPFFSKLPTQVGPYNVFGLTFPSGKESTSRVIHRQTILHQFESLKKVAEESGPKFIISHMLFPHDPYVFDENCNTFKSRYTDEYKVYINQLKCTNTKIQQLVDYILSHSDTKPIIIIQSDEGPYPKAFRQNRDLNWGDASLEMLQQKAEILNAYYFPNKNYSKLYQSISPVNSFRVVFDQYLGTDLGLIDDKHYFPESEKRRFFLLDMTDKFEK
jgi:hypothetical protein